MIKKIAATSLKPGMFVHDFNCAWLENPFFASQMKISSEGEVKKVISQGIKEVYIDTEKGDDLSEGKPLQEVEKEIDKGFEKLDRKPPIKKRLVPVQEEMRNAVKVRKQAMDVVQNFMADARLGKQVDVNKVDKVVDKVVDSIFKNKDALEILGKVRTADEYTFMHSMNVCVLMVTFAKSMDMDVEEIRGIGQGAMLHDIGKMRVDNKVLNKAGRLTEEEFAQMKKHVEFTRDLLKVQGGISKISMQVASQHHERFDGLGYWQGLKGEQISKAGQMASIVDVYDAITSDRVYHKGMNSVDALRRMFEWRGQNFDGDLVQQFIRAVGIYPTGTLVRLESGRLGVVLEQGEADLLHPIIRVIYDSKKERYITPFVADLSHPPPKLGEDSVVGPEPAEKWKINPMEYLDMPELTGL